MKTLISIFLAVGFVGCASVDFEQFLEKKYPNCSTMILEKTTYEYRVRVDCPGEELRVDTYRRK